MLKRVQHDGRLGYVRRMDEQEISPEEFERQLVVARKVMAKRCEALRDLAMGEQIMEEDRAILAALAKS